MKNLIKTLISFYINVLKNVILMIIVIFSFLLLINLLMKDSSDKVRMRWVDYSNLKTKINTENFKIKEFKLTEKKTFKIKDFKLKDLKSIDIKTFKKEPALKSSVKLYKKDNKFNIIIKNYSNYCSNINGSYIVDGKDKYEYFKDLEIEEELRINNKKINLNKPKKYTINIIPKEKNYIKSQIYNCTYDILLEIDRDFKADDIIYLLLNGNIYKYNMKDIV